MAINPEKLTFKIEPVAVLDSGGKIAAMLADIDFKEGAVFVRGRSGNYLHVGYLTGWIRSIRDRNGRFVP